MGYERRRRAHTTCMHNHGIVRILVSIATRYYQEERAPETGLAARQ